MKKVIKDQTFDQERALYNLKDIKLLNVTFEGELDGESCLKESRNCEVLECMFALRYPLWHVDGLSLNKSTFKETSRAPIWYTSNGMINECTLNCPKALRECSEINIDHSSINSAEFGWKCNYIKLDNSEIESDYLFFDSNNITLNNVQMKGKYSFQYIKNLNINNSNLDTKDAFWHSENVYVKNSILKGEYLGWYSKNVTFEKCTIIGTQPLCYCENIELIDCKMIDTDLAFEESTVEGRVTGNIKSIKNPIEIHIICDSLDELIIEDNLHEPKIEIYERNYLYEKLD